MSTEAMAAVLRAKIDDASKKAVLIGMAEHAGPDGGHCFVSIARLMAYTSLSRSTIKAKLSEMVEARLIEVTEEARQHRPRVYRIDLNRLAHMCHPIIRDLDERNRRPPISGGAEGAKSQGASSRPPENQTVNEDLPDGQLTGSDGQMTDPDGQMTDPGVQLSAPNQVLNPQVLNPLNQEQNRGQFSKSETVLDLALEALKRTTPRTTFEKYFEPLQLVDISGELVLLRCDTIDQALWLMSNGIRYLEHSMAGVLGRRVTVEVEPVEQEVEAA